MRSQPNRNYVSNDDIPTPVPLARALVEILRPEGRILEPCVGEGSFLLALPEGTEWCEIKRGRDFYEWCAPVDWIVTNPPWSQMRRFLRHSFAIADHVAVLITINHVWTRARLRDAREQGFGLKQIILVDTPASFPQSGFQLGMVVYQRGYTGPIELFELRGQWS
jgi:hypothetical protein